MEAIKVGVIADQTGPLSSMGIANAYIAQAHDGDFKVVNDLGVIDPKEAVLSIG